MATVKISKSQARQFAAQFGNTAVFAFPLSTTATGAAASSDSAVALAIGDVVDLGPLPEGMRLDDSIVVVSTALTAAVTGSLGFKYEDGIDSSVVPQDAAYFGAGVVLSAAARLRNASAAALVTLPKPARLILTIAGAGNAKASKVEFVIYGELTGPK